MDIFSLGFLYLIMWLLKNAAMDVSYALKGKTNPRWELKRDKARAAGQNPPAQPRYGTRDWFNDLLADGLQAQTEWRRRQAAAKRQAREQAELEQAEAQQAEAQRAEAERAEAERAEAERAEAERAAGEQQNTDPAPADPPAPEQTSGPGAGGAPDPEQQPTPRPTSPPDGPTAKVIPFPTKPQEEPVSTDINSEVIGLDQSIAYAHSLATFAGEHGQAGNEGYIAHLTGSKVAGEGLSTAAAMQEAFSNAEAAAEAHAVELERQKAVQEAYDANPDAGDKEFQTEGR